MSVYGINGNVAQTVYDVTGNALTQAYDINGYELMSVPVFDDSTTVTNVYTSNINLYPQGGCMDDEGNLCTCLMPAGTSSTVSKFIKHNISTGDDVIITVDGANYGHGNGMAYNPNNERFYLTSMKDTGEVYVFNKSFELVDTLYARDENGDVYTCFNLAYNRISRRFISMTHGKMFFYDSDLNYITHSTYDPADWPQTCQDIETDGKYVYGVSYNPNSLSVFDFQGNFIKLITNTGFTGEPENLCYDWSSDFYMSGKASYFVIRKVEFIET